MESFEQDFHEGQIIDEWYEVTHHTTNKPLYERIYSDFDPSDPLAWGGVQVRDIRDNWLGWHRIWPH